MPLNVYSTLNRVVESSERLFGLILSHRLLHPESNETAFGELSSIILFSEKLQKTGWTLGCTRLKKKLGAGFGRRLKFLEKFGFSVTCTWLQPTVSVFSEVT
jgi:hypothetical protein